MNTKLILTSSSILMAIAGLAASFIPNEILTYFGYYSTGFEPLVIQVIGSLYFGFAMMNWMARDFIIGGIYARPIAMGNFVHFLIAGLALVKVTFSSPGFPVLWIVTIVYAIFALLFYLIAFRHPKTEN